MENQTQEFKRLEVLQAKSIDRLDRLQEKFLILNEKITDFEYIYLSNTKNSHKARQTMLMLMFCLFAILFLLILLGLSVEAEVGRSKLQYSANGILQVIIAFATLGGGAGAIAGYQKINRIIK